MAELTTKPAPGTPTQVAHPGRTTLRTIIQAGIPSFLALLVVVPQVIEAVLAEPSIPDDLRLWLAGAAAAVTALAGIVARIMAIPGVENFLTKLKLDTGVSKEPPPSPPEALEEDNHDEGAPETEGIDYEGTYAIDPLPVIPDEDGRRRGEYLGG